MRVFSVICCKAFLRPLFILSLFLLGFPLAQANNGPAPVGIYLLGPLDSDANIEQIKDRDFVTGYNYRIRWSTLETAPGQYDFSQIDNAITELHAAGKKMSISVFANSVPQYVLDNSETFVFGTGNAAGRNVPLPWDSFAMSTYEDFVTQFANHPITLAHADGSSSEILFNQHPALTSVSSPILGLQGVRDTSHTFVNLPEYERGLFIDSAVEAIKINRSLFRNQFGFLAFFKLDDDLNPDLPLDVELRERLMSEFNNPGQPSLGLFQELLSDVGPMPETMGQHLAAVADRTYVMFQALKPWSIGTDKVASGDPGVGLELGYSHYGASYYELYLADITNPDMQDTLSSWHEFFLETVPQTQQPISAESIYYADTGIVDIPGIEVIGATQNNFLKATLQEHEPGKFKTLSISQIPEKKGNASYQLATQTLILPSVKVAGDNSGNRYYAELLKNRSGVFILTQVRLKP